MTHELCRFRHPPTGAMVIWELTRYCNLACLHCCTNSDPRVSRSADLPTSAIRRAIDEMTDYGVREFFFSGGEPLSRLDFQTIVSFIDADRVDAFVNTNGYHLTEAMARTLATTALRRVTISIDGATPDIHARFRLKPGSYHRAIRAVRACQLAGLPVRVSHVVGAPNIAHVDEFVRQMAGLGVDRIVINTAFPAGRAVEHPELLLTDTQLTELARRLIALRAECRAGGVELDFSLGNPVAGDVPRGCPAGAQVLYVAADGTVSGCSWLYKIDADRFGVGNLHRETFAAMRDKLRAQNERFAGREGCPLPLLATGT